MTRTSKSPKTANGERRRNVERRSSAENRREYERFSPTQKPSERRRTERRIGGGDP
jgi:hypothetical protein